MDSLTQKNIFEDTKIPRIVNEHSKNSETHVKMKLKFVALREREREREGFVLYICMSVCLSFGEFYKGKNEQNEAYARNEGGLVDKR